MIVISTREFRQNQKEYFERVDKGERIIVQRGKDKSYLLTPVTEDDLYFNEKMLERIKKSLEEIKKGESKEISSPSDIRELLGL